MFSHILDNRSLVSTIVYIYKNWSGRLFLNIIIMTTIVYHLLWKLAIPFCLILSAYSSWSITLRETISIHKGICLVLVLILCIPLVVAQEAEWWVTGFYNYLLPTSLGLYAINTLIRQQQATLISKVLGLIALTIAAFSEQVAICLILSSSFIVVFRFYTKKMTWFEITYYLLLIMCVCILFTAPGSYARAIVEAKRHFPEFHSYNLLQHISMGMDRLNIHITQELNLLFIITCIISYYVALHTFQQNTLKKMIVISIMAANLFIIIFANFCFPSLLKYIHTGSLISLGNGSVYLTYLSQFLTLITLSTMLEISLNSVKDAGENIIGFVALSCGALAVITLGLTPTVYVSGQRILYIFDVMLIVYTCTLLNQLLKSISIRYLPMT